MKTLLLASLVFLPLFAGAYSIDPAKAQFLYLGAGITEANLQVHNHCLEGNKTNEKINTQVTYKLRKVPEDDSSFSRKGSTKIIIEMNIVTHLSKIENIKADDKLKQYNFNARKFYEVCGDSYVKSLELGGSAYRIIFVSNEEAEKVFEFEITEDATRSSKVEEFIGRAFDAIKDVNSSGFGGGSVGGYLPELFGTAVEQFTAYRNFYLSYEFASGSSTRGAPAILQGAGEAYPEAVKKELIRRN